MQVALEKMREAEVRIKSKDLKVVTEIPKPSEKKPCCKEVEVSPEHQAAIDKLNQSYRQTVNIDGTVDPTGFQGEPYPILVEKRRESIRATEADNLRQFAALSDNEKLWFVHHCVDIINGDIVDVNAGLTPQAVLTSLYNLLTRSKDIKLITSRWPHLLSALEKLYNELRSKRIELK